MTAKKQNPTTNQLSAGELKKAERTETVLNGENVDAHVDNHISTITAAVRSDLETPTLAAIYLAARPVLLLVEGLLFFKPKWRTALKVLIAGLDAEYPTAVTE